MPRVSPTPAQQMLLLLAKLLQKKVIAAPSANHSIGGGGRMRGAECGSFVMMSLKGGYWGSSEVDPTAEIYASTQIHTANPVQTLFRVT